MKILLTNDDGIQAPGLRALYEALKELGDVTVVAPKTEQSGIGHAITYKTPIRAERVESEDGGEWIAVAGTPTDCVKFGLMEVLRIRPDLVASGINMGLNLGFNIFYSGTAAAAIEGAMHGIPSLAVSTGKNNAHQLDRVAQQALRVARQVISMGAGASGRQECLPSGEGLRHHPVLRALAYNVNVPELRDAEPEIMFTRHKASPFPEHYVRQDGDGGPAYQLDLRQGVEQPEAEMCDARAIESGFISVTPLRASLTDTESLDALNGILGAACGQPKSKGRAGR